MDKKNRRNLGLLAAAAGAAGFLGMLAQPAHTADLGDVDDPIKLAINEWTGQHITTHVGASILREAGYTVELVAAGNYPQHQALADGDIHATLEVWDNNSGDIFPVKVAAGEIVVVGDTGLEANEGWLYPIHMEDTCPGLPDWEALVECADRLATAETFPKGRILSYPADWGNRSELIIEGLGIPYKAVPAGSEGALVAELKAAATAESPLVMMFWAPHWVFSEVKVGWVDKPVYHEDCATDPAWGPNPEMVNDCGVFKPTTLKVAWAGFEEKWPAAYKLLEQFTMDTAAQEAMMKAIDGDGMKLEEVVAKHVAATQSTWQQWVDKATM